MGKVIAEKFVVTDNIGITRLTKNPQKITSDKEIIKTLHFLFNCRQIILFITFNNTSGEAGVFEDEMKKPEARLLYKLCAFPSLSGSLHNK